MSTIRSYCVQTRITTLLGLLFLCVKSETSEVSTKYEPNWDSLESRPLPHWFDNAKVGIFIHWGVFSVPSVTSEWFWFDWNVPQHNEKLHDDIVEFMKDNYKPTFTYQDFAKEFTAEFFNATEWAEIIGQSGAKYVVLTSKHHEGYTLWPSKYSYSWNSVDVGPHRDIVGELAESIRKSDNGITFGLYHSLFEWFNPLYQSDKYRNFTTQEFVNNKIFPEMKELVNKYKPEIFWSDGEAEAPSSYWRSEEFIAWLYNESPVSESIIINDRWGTGTSCTHGGYYTCADRYSPGKLQNRKWENAMTIDKNTWGYNRRSNLEDYLTNQELIDTLVETVAFGGNLLVNIGPTKDGKIAPIFQDRLFSMGQWLSTNGLAIYYSSPWEKCQNDTLTTNVWYTTHSQELYVIFLRWPKTGILYLSCPEVTKNSIITFIERYKNPVLDWIITDNELLKISLPDKSEIDGLYGWVLKITNSNI